MIRSTVFGATSAFVFLASQICFAQPQPAAAQPQPASIVEIESEAMAVAPDAATSEPQPQRSRRENTAPPGRVSPTASGSLGGATPQTRTMPLDLEGLVALRRLTDKRPEFRAAWITRFDWTRGRERQFDPVAAKALIIEMLNDAQRIGLNAVLFQVRGDATVLYRSTLEPWSQLIGGKDPGFDPLQFAIEESHKRGLEFHAYVNPIPCSDEKAPQPANPQHIWYKHCLPESSPHWLVHKNGKPAADSEYKWFNPNLPDVQVYIRTVMLDLVRRYDIDGIHFDRIRFPSKDVSDDPWSKARYGVANPQGLPYNEWQTENINRLLIDIYGGIQDIKPRVKVSSSVWGIYDRSKLPQGRDRATGYSWTSSGLQDYMQDSIAWINRGCMDALVPMIYWNMGDNKPDYDELLLSFTSNVRSGRHIYGGQAVFSKEEMLREAIATTLVGSQGTVAFTLNRIRGGEMGEFYRTVINPNRVPVPEMPWKTNPTTGNLLVTVLNAQGRPVTDAHVTVEGNRDTALSSADGYCAFLNLPPGQIAVRADDRKGGIASGKLQISAGKTVKINVRLTK